MFQRSLATLRHLLAHSTEALNSACDQKIHIHVIRILKVSFQFQGNAEAEL